MVLSGGLKNVWTKCNKSYTTPGPLPGFIQMKSSKLWLLAVGERIKKGLFIKVLYGHFWGAQSNFKPIYKKMVSPVVWMGGYEGGGLIHDPSGRLMCLRSDENSSRYVSAGITRKYLRCSGGTAWSDLNVSVTYLWKYVGNGSVVSKSKTRHRCGVGLCIKKTW